MIGLASMEAATVLFYARSEGSGARKIYDLKYYRMTELIKSF